jgi:hypothetical protein
MDLNIGFSLSGSFHRTGGNNCFALLGNQKVMLISRYSRISGALLQGPRKYNLGGVKYNLSG